MKKLLLILALSLTFGIGTVQADHHGRPGHKTEKRHDYRPGNKGNKGNKGKHDKHDRKDNRHKKHYDDHKHYGRPGIGYRPAPPPRPVPPPPPPRHHHHHHYGPDPALAYVIGVANVLFNGVAIPGVNMPSFQVLDYGYARDAYHVYYNGRVLRHANPATFRIMPDGYATDGWNLYYFGKRVKR